MRLVYANKQTTEKLAWVLDRCRELYNAGLQERRDAYEMAVRQHPNYYHEQTRKQLTREHIDLGVTHFAALSNGTFIDHPRYLRHAENTLAKAQKPSHESSAGA